MPPVSPASPRAILGGARVALAFLTRIPASVGLVSEAQGRWAAAWFPVIGALVGAISAVAWSVASVAGALPAAIVAVAMSMLVTGALHEDGLADTADALGGAYDRERMFEILKDSRIGTFGAAALTMSLLLRVALLAQLGSDAPTALIVVGACARTPPVWLMAALPYVTPKGGRSHALVAAGWPQAVAATLVAAALLSLFPTGNTTSLIAAAVGVALLCGWRFRVRAGGLTGDFLGATEQLAECALLLVLASQVPG